MGTTDGTFGSPIGGSEKRLVPHCPERVTFEVDANLRREVRKSRAAIGEDRFDVSHARSKGLAGLCADLNPEDALARVCGVVSAPEDCARVKDGRPVARIGRGGEAGAERIELANDLGHMGDGVDTTVWGRSMGGLAMNDQVDPAETLMLDDGSANAQRLENDRSIERVARDQVGGPDRERLLVNRAGNDKIATQSSSGGDDLAQCEKGNRARALVVGDADTNEMIARALWSKGPISPIGIADGVGMGIQTEGPTATGSVKAGQDVRATWRDLLKSHIGARARQPIADEARDRFLTSSVRNQRRRDRINPDERREEVLDLCDLNGHEQGPSLLSLKRAWIGNDVDEPDTP
jgi:hypothetical protein